MTGDAWPAGRVSPTSRARADAAPGGVGDGSSPPGPLRIAVLVKQVPTASDLRLGADGRLVRDSADLELGAYCRRAVGKAVELAAADPASSVAVLTLGPPCAEDAVREGVAWGLDHGVDTTGLLVSDPRLAGSDTFATARALAAVLRHRGPFDLVLTGRQSLDADTGQVPPQVAEMLDLPFAAGVKRMDFDGAGLVLGCEHDDAWVEVALPLPAVLSCAERLCAPAKVAPAGRVAVPDSRVTRVTASDLGPGPWGDEASLTRVGQTRPLSVARRRLVAAAEPVAVQIERAVGVLVERRALTARAGRERDPLPDTGGPGPVVAVVAEPGAAPLTRELCGVAADLAHALHGSTAVLAPHGLDAAEAGSWGADRLVRVTGALAEEDVARAVVRWASAAQPWAIVTGSTAWGREVAARVAAVAVAGLTGDAIGLQAADGRLVAWKAAFSGELAVSVTATTALQMATVRPGVAGTRRPRAQVASCSEVAVEPRRRVAHRARRVEDSLHSLAEAEVVVGVGLGVDPADYAALAELCELLGAELGCTRRVTDRGWMPHARQIGVTGRAIAPRLYVAIGTSGRFNHMAGVRAAGTVLAVNPDPAAPVWGHCDAGIVGPWQEVVPLLSRALHDVLPGAGAPRRADPDGHPCTNTCS